MNLFDGYEQQIAEQYQDVQRAPIMGAGERAILERDLRYGAHPIQGEAENSAYQV